MYYIIICILFFFDVMRAGWVARKARKPASAQQLPPILPRAPPGRAVAAAVSGELRGGRGNSATNKPYDKLSPT